MSDHDKAIRQRARDDAYSLDFVRPPFSSALEVAQDLVEYGDGPDAFLTAVAVLGEERAAEIYDDEWDAILRKTLGDEALGDEAGGQP